jgi:hypothetical protein
MAEPLVVHRYWIVDERSGVRRLTSAHLSAQEAARRHPGAEPEPASRERRWLVAAAAPRRVADATET